MGSKLHRNRWETNHTQFLTSGSCFWSISLDFLKDFGRPCWTRSPWIFFWCNISNQKGATWKSSKPQRHLDVFLAVTSTCVTQELKLSSSFSSFRMSQTSRVSKVGCLSGPYLSNAASIRMLEIGNLTHLHPWCNLFQLDFKHEKMPRNSFSSCVPG